MHQAVMAAQLSRIHSQGSASDEKAALQPCHAARVWGSAPWSRSYSAALSRSLS